jgi:hypothetical protein
LQENIHSLVNGELDEAARKTLLEQAKTDPKMADELLFSQSLAQTLRRPDWAAAKATLSAVIAEEGFPPPAPPAALQGGWGKWWIGAGAVVLTLLSLSGAYFWAESRGFFPSKAQKISRAAVRPLENVLFLPSGGQALADLQSGMAAYEAGRYAEAASLLDVYANRNSDNAVRIYLGVSRLMSGQAEKAVPPLADAAQSPEPPIQEVALWYLALAYLENDNPRAAKQALELIPPEGLYGAQARELLEKLW